MTSINKYILLQEEIRKHLTDIIQHKMAELKLEAEGFHQKVYNTTDRCSWCVDYKIVSLCNQGFMFYQNGSFVIAKVFVPVIFFALGKGPDLVQFVKYTQSDAKIGKYKVGNREECINIRLGKVR